MATTRKLVAHYVDESGAPRALALAAPVAKPVSKLNRMLVKKGFANATLVTLDGARIDGDTAVGALGSGVVAIRHGDVGAVGRPPLLLDAGALDGASLATLAELGVHALRTPVVIRGATGRALDLERWTATLVERLRKRSAEDAQFVFRVRDGRRSAKEEPPSVFTFRDVLDEHAPASTPARSGITMCELALQREPDLLARVLGALPLDACRPAWAPRGANLFESSAFPELLRPPPMCLVVGGDGASCDLHADHYGWIGWSLLCRGRKTWRFSEQTPARDAEYAATRQAVFDEVQGLSDRGIAGSFQSAVDLYAAGTDRHASDFEVATRPGDLLLSPGDLWHQTLHGGSTLSVCSQFCSAAGLGAVLAHVRAWRGAARESESAATLPAPKRVMATLVECLGAARAGEVASLRTETAMWRTALARELGAPTVAGGVSPGARDSGSDSEDVDGFGGMD